MAEVTHSMAPTNWEDSQEGGPRASLLALKLGWGPLRIFSPFLMAENQLVTGVKLVILLRKWFFLSIQKPLVGGWQTNPFETEELLKLDLSFPHFISLYL